MHAIPTITKYHRVPKCKAVPLVLNSNFIFFIDLSTTTFYVSLNNES